MEHISKFAQYKQQSPEQRERIEKSVRDKENRERKIKISQNLTRLNRDVGARLTRARISNFEITEEGQKEVIADVQRYVDNIDKHFAEGQGVFLVGNPGTGKDHLAISIARAAIIRLNVPARWLDMATFRGELRDSISGKKNEKDILDKYIKPGFLVMSDPVSPGATLTNFQSEMIFRIIDTRWRELRPTIITSNFANETEAVAALGSQIVDRLSHGGLRLRCQWASYRRK